MGWAGGRAPAGRGLVGGAAAVSALLLVLLHLLRATWCGPQYPPTTFPSPSLPPPRPDDELSERERAAVARKPAEHQALFGGNTDDHFRMGIKLTR